MQGKSSGNWELPGRRIRKAHLSMKDAGKILLHVEDCLLDAALPIVRKLQIGREVKRKLGIAGETDQKGTFIDEGRGQDPASCRGLPARRSAPNCPQTSDRKGSQAEIGNCRGDGSERHIYR